MRVQFYINESFPVYHTHFFKILDSSSYKIAVTAITQNSYGFFNPLMCWIGLVILGTYHFSGSCRASTVGPIPTYQIHRLQNIEEKTLIPTCSTFFMFLQMRIRHYIPYSIVGTGQVLPVCNNSLEDMCQCAGGVRYCTVPRYLLLRLDKVLINKIILKILFRVMC